MWPLRLACLPAALASLEVRGDAAAPAALEAPGDAVALLQQPLAVRHMMMDFAFLPPQKHRPVMWVHLPQADAEPMCEMAKANGERFMYTTDMSTCNWQPYDDYRATPPAHMPDCYSRQQAWLASSFTWTQIDRPLRDEDICSGYWFFYGAIVGDPVKLVKSKLAADPSLMKIVDCIEARKKGYAAACADTLLSPAAEGTWKYFDNPQVRMLGGPEVWALPPGAVNVTHFRAALARAKGFDLVIVAERLARNFMRDRLRAAFHWENFTTSDAFASQLELHRFDLKAFDLSRIQRLNEHDKLLYDMHVKEAMLNDESPFKEAMNAAFDDY